MWHTKEVVIADGRNRTIATRPANDINSKPIKLKKNLNLV